MPERFSLQQSMTVALGLGAELLNDGKFRRAPYTYGGKGWGGALIDGDGNRIGHDCTSLPFCGFRRLGLIPHGKFGGMEWRFVRAKYLPDFCEKVTSPAPFDLVFFSGHVGVVVDPGRLYMDFGGGDRDTQPGGSDWPAKNGRFRFRRWDYMNKQHLGYGRFRAQVGPEDHAIIAAWEAHVAQTRAGQKPALSSELVSLGYRPMWQDYGE